jgi:hypothetical protein
VSEKALDTWHRRGTPLEGLAAKALAHARQRKPERYRHRNYGEVAAYGSRWASGTAFCGYYFGSTGRVSAIRRTMETPKTEMSWGKAALEHILHLFDIGELGADCRWSAEREAARSKQWLPLNRDAREVDDLNMASFHAGIQATHARERALGEASRRQRATAGAP